MYLCVFWLKWYSIYYRSLKISPLGVSHTSHSSIVCNCTVDHSVNCFQTRVDEIHTWDDVTMWKKNWMVYTWCRRDTAAAQTLWLTDFSFSAVRKTKAAAGIRTRSTEVHTVPKHCVVTAVCLEIVLNYTSGLTILHTIVENVLIQVQLSVNLQDRK